MSPWPQHRGVKCLTLLTVTLTPKKTCIIRCLMHAHICWMLPVTDQHFVMYPISPCLITGLPCAQEAVLIHDRDYYRVETSSVFDNQKQKLEVSRRLIIKH